MSEVLIILFWFWSSIIVIYIAIYFLIEYIKDKIWLRERYREDEI